MPNLIKYIIIIALLFNFFILPKNALAADNYTGNLSACHQTYSPTNDGALLGNTTIVFNQPTSITKVQVKVQGTDNPNSTEFIIQYTGPTSPNTQYTLNTSSTKDGPVKLSPGNYSLTIEVTDSSGNKHTCSKDNAYSITTPGGVSTKPGSNPCTTDSCETAIGQIPTDTTAFVGRVLSIALGLAGGIALIFMVFGSIKVLTSTGDPKKVGEGREVIVAAIAGLLFLILSVLILRFIGGIFLPTNPFS